MNLGHISWILQIIVFVACNTGFAQDLKVLVAPEVSPSNIPLFQSDEILELEMKMPFAKVRDGKKGERFAGVVSTRGNKLNSTIGVEFSARGNSRRTLCRDFPPFKINLPKKGTKGTLFANADDDLKFVPQCDLRPDNSDTDDMTLREYTLYKMLATSSLPSLKVRLAHVIYIDETGAEVTRGLGFFIESVKDFNVRTKGERASRGWRSQQQLKGAVAVSQALLKNPDWWINENPDMSQNVKTIFDEAGTVVEYISYDFDLSIYARSSDHARWWNDSEVLEKATRGEFDGYQALLTVIGKESDIRRVFEEGLLRESSKDHFRRNFDVFIASAQKRAADLEDFNIESE